MSAEAAKKEAITAVASSNVGREIAKEGIKSAYVSKV
jgi:hypothetical protein